MAIKKLFIDQAVANSSLAAAISQRLNLTGEIVAGPQPIHDWISTAGDPVKKAKEVLFLTRNRGAFVRDCPGTRCYTCCGYQILHIGTFCSMDCSYCILQSYFHPPVLQFFVNQGDLFKELDAVFAERKKIHRLGTGEFTDSLIWELWTDLSRRLVPAFASQKHAVLELKTKTSAVENLRGLDHQRKTIVAWSLNTPRVIASEERGTASLDARLSAAAKCAAWGYPLGFHFDPIVIYEGCETDYRWTVSQLFSRLDSKDIVWISLGSFRFMPALKPLIEKRFSKSKITCGEFIAGLDGKMRYFKPLRIRIYREIIAAIRRVAPHVRLYFCMEDDEVWQKTLGFTPSQQGGLPAMLDAAAKRHCDLEEI